MIYECEDCGGSFDITPELDETVEHCPQCGNDNTVSFKLAVQDDRR